MPRTTAKADEAPVSARTVKRQHKEMIEAFKTALDEYPVLVYNGQGSPVTKPIGLAITCISEDLRSTRDQVHVHTSLLEGIRTRRAFFASLWETFEKMDAWLKLRPRWKITRDVIVVLTSLWGIWSLIDKVFLQ